MKYHIDGRIESSELFNVFGGLVFSNYIKEDGIIGVESCLRELILTPNQDVDDVIFKTINKLSLIQVSRNEDPREIVRILHSFNDTYSFDKVSELLNQGGNLSANDYITWVISEVNVYDLMDEYCMMALTEYTKLIWDIFIKNGFMSILPSGVKDVVFTNTVIDQMGLFPHIDMLINVIE